MLGAVDRLALYWLRGVMRDIVVDGRVPAAYRGAPCLPLPRLKTVPLRWSGCSSSATSSTALIVHYGRRGPVVAVVIPLLFSIVLFLLFFLQEKITAWWQFPVHRVRAASRRSCGRALHAFLARDRAPAQLCAWRRCAELTSLQSGAERWWPSRLCLARHCRTCILLLFWLSGARLRGVIRRRTGEIIDCAAHARRLVDGASSRAHAYRIVIRRICACDDCVAPRTRVPRCEKWFPFRVTAR